jgi:hypothetical protein
MEVGIEKKKKEEDDFALFSLFYVTCTLPVLVIASWMKGRNLTIMPIVLTIYYLYFCCVLG